MRLALGLEYDGSRFCGWQTQPSGCGLQDHLEAALTHVAAQRVQTICGGRTDAGVHALGQVVHFDTDARRPLSAWVRGVNASLPLGFSVLWSREVNPEFHARYAATSRSYRYVLLNRPVRPAAACGRVGWFHLRLDVERMRNAARLLLGEHDFSAFRSSECQARSPVRHLQDVEIEADAEYVIFAFRANAFLQHMVRNLVGALVYVGSGKRDPEWIGEVLRSRDRTQAAPTFDAAGLCLAYIHYDPHWGLPPAAIARSRHWVGA